MVTNPTHLIIWLSLLASHAAMAYEQPDYKVLSKTDTYEIRQYAAFLTAKTTAQGTYKQAGNQAFRKLFGYISGDNQQQNKLSMTIPVTSQAQPAGENISMTIPVLSEAKDAQPSQASGHTFRFVMPADYNLATLPSPNQQDIIIERVEARVVAARRFGGRSTEKRFLKQQKKLLDTLSKDGITTLGTPNFAVYNGPFTPWLFRRNEVLIDITPPK